jgi:Xaa-Pro aminopeptidase
MAEPIFPKTEFEERWARARERMDRSGLRALVAYSPGNQFWLTGFTGASAPDE